MKLITKQIEKRIPPLYSTDGKKGNRKIPVKFFTPDSNWTWFVLEGEKQPDGDWRFFGLVEGFETELGYFHLAELIAARGPLGLPIDRDTSFDSGQKTLEKVAPDFCDRLWS